WDACDLRLCQVTACSRCAEGGCEPERFLLRWGRNPGGRVMQQRTGRVRTLLTLALSIVLAGTLLAGLLPPWVGAPPVAAAQSGSLLGAPPVELTDEPPAPGSVMLAANGELITSFYQENRAPVTGDQIAEVMKHAMVAGEHKPGIQS